MVWLLVSLALLAFLQAFFLFPTLFGPDRNGTPVVRDINLPEREIRVLVAEGPPSLLLKTTLDLPAADRLDAEELDRALFPGGERHVYYLLYVLNDRGEEQEIDFSAEGLVLENDAGGTFTPVPLAGPLAKHVGGMPEYLAFQLKAHLESPANGGGRRMIPAHSRLRTLLAYPAGAVPERIVRGRLGDLELVPKPMQKDALDRLLDREGVNGSSERS